ncbi:MAG TPA: glycosyltransferase family 1 protein, partial [Candidatus Eisenbacteria bacterium]|nr:glycosyltransferase family 1 protein [Candidatus Eisenbacteria bacterium]
RAGHDVHFCCSPGDLLESLEEEGFPVFALPIARSYDPAKHLVSFWRLYRFLRRTPFDVVHAHTPVAGLIGRAAARLAGVPFVVYTAHGFYFHEGMKPAVRRLFVSLERFGGRLSDLVLVQSEEDYREALRERIMPGDRLVHIGNGVDPGLFGAGVHAAKAAEAKRELGLDGGPVVGFVGRIVREKGVIEFVRAAAAVRRDHPRAQFVMVGAPLESDRDDCRELVGELAGELGISKALHMAGYRKDVPVLLSLFDLFVLPSYREGMPRALLEAMASGLPVVASDIRGCREEVEEGVTGLLVPPRDHERLAEAISRLLGEKERARRMGEAARARVAQRFDEKRIVSLQVRLLEELARRPREN